MLCVVLKTQSYFESTSLCPMPVDVTRPSCHICISFGGLCCYDFLLSKAHENNATNYHCQITENFEISPYRLYKSFYFNLDLMHHKEETSTFLMAEVE